jgi:beta-alanine--pyruvate transaminase
MSQPLDAYWMPFTANRQFKKAPRLLAKASGMHYWTTTAARSSTRWPACGA